MPVPLDASESRRGWSFLNGAESWRGEKHGVIIEQSELQLSLSRGEGNYDVQGGGVCSQASSSGLDVELLR